MSQYLIFQLHGPMASWGVDAPGEGNNTTSNKTSNKGTFSSSKIDSIHISIHVYHSLGDYTSLLSVIKLVAFLLQHNGNR